MKMEPVNTKMSGYRDERDRGEKERRRKSEREKDKNKGIHTQKMSECETKL